MTTHNRLAWLALTPEPERELPEAVALLRSGSADRERRRLEALVLRGTSRSWRRYLHEVCEQIRALPEHPAPELLDAALLAAEVLLEHHRMLIGLPGSGYRETEADRRYLTATVARLRAERERSFA